MSRRPPLSELEFGSDSFLDVLANVVGVLIILMVLAGLRAAKAPVDLTSTSPVPATTTSEPDSSPTLELPANESETESPSAALAMQSEALFLESEIEQLRATAEQLDDKLKQSREQLTEQQHLLTTLAQNQSDEPGSDTETTKLESAARQVRATLKQRLADVAKIEKTPSRVQQLEHRITPLSRVVMENELELHFRCLAGRVAYVPVTELVERMRAQVQRQRDLVLRTKRFTGSVGPVRGFSLDYLTQNEEVPMLGGVMQRTQLVGFQLAAEPDLESEGLAEALRPESAFRNEIRRVDPGATITFWVYPDSFTMYRQLQTVAHQAGYQVAARPLPAGIPIMGSPHGSRSSAQ